MAAPLHVNGRAYRSPEAPTVVVCVDGCEPDYIAQAVAAGRAMYEHVMESKERTIKNHQRPLAAATARAGRPAPERSAR